MVCISVLVKVPERNLVIRFEGAATLRALVQTRRRASRRPDSTFVVICDEKEEEIARDLHLKEQNMKDAIERLMENRTLPLQAEEFGCEVQRPKLNPEEKENSESAPIELNIERYNPRVTVSVHHLADQQHRVIDAES